MKDANFRVVDTPDGPRVLVDLGEWTRYMIIDHRTSFEFARAFERTAKGAERYATRGPALTPKEVDAMEESLGTPRLLGAP